MTEHETSKPAPDPLDLVQRFVNSLDIDDGIEELQTPENLRDWLAERGLLSADEAVSEGDVRRAIDVREGLRALLLANNGEEVAEAAGGRRGRGWSARRAAPACA